MAGMRFSAMKSAISFRLLNIKVSDASKTASGRVSFTLVSAFSMSAAPWISTTSILTPRFTRGLQIELVQRIGGICKDRDPRQMRNSLLEQFETFAFQFDVQRYESREVCIGSGKIRNKADIHNIARRADQNRNRRGGALGGECSRAAPGDQDVHRHRHELSSKFGKTIIT